MDADVVVIALGTNPNPLVPRTTYGLEVDQHGCIVADPQTGATSREGVYAGGDIVTGAATVILAMGAGRRAAGSMHEYLQRAAADEREAKEFQRGRRDGIVWARDYAAADELRDLVENFEPGQGSDFGVDHSVCDFTSDREQVKTVSVPHHDDPFWRGFVAGAEEVMDCQPSALET
jgi:hypothetical protein